MNAQEEPQAIPKKSSYCLEEDEDDLDKPLTAEQLQWCYENL
jgi:hypothetical protein